MGPQPAQIDVAVLGLGLVATHDSLDPRHQFARGKRLHHVIVDARFEPADAIVFLTARGQHDDRYFARHLLTTQAPREFEPTHAGQHPVEQDEVGHALHDRFLCRSRVGGVHGLHAGAGHRERDHVANGGLIFDDQYLFLHCRVMS